MALLLAPAGGMDSLKAAVAAGADEIYLGGTRFSARAYAKNFTDSQLEEAGSLCREAGVRLHIALNTLVTDAELPGVLDYVRFLETSVRPDAYIVQDLGLARLLKESYPDAVLHASTQLRQHASAGAEILRKLGFTRVVLAREMSKEDIESYVRNSDLETEVFVHGALCVCESGGCLMSSVIGKRSGNRGECAQPCRLPYRGAARYPLSLKDNCLASHLEELSAMGVTAFKIEGRMKSPDYVYRVTSVYRTLLDEHRAPTEKELKELEDAFSRSGFTDGYYTKKTGPHMFGVRREEDKYKDKSKETTAENQRSCVRPGRTASVSSPLPLQLPERDPEAVLSPKEQLGYVARLEGMIPKDLSLFSDAARIDIPLFALRKTDLSGLEDRVSALLPRVTFDSESDALRRALEEAYARGVRRATVPNLSALSLLDGWILHGDYPLNVYNRETRKLLESFPFSSLFLSPEADPSRFAPSEAAMEALGYGRIPLMHTETCLIRNILGSCMGSGSGKPARCHAELVDRTGAVFPVFRADGHRNIVYNSLPTYRLDRRKDLRKAGVGLLTLLFTTERETDMKQIVRCYREASPRPAFPYTRR